MTTPASVPADGNLRISFLLALANPAAPTVLELNAATGVDMTCYLTADGWSPGVNEAVITDDRLCSTQTYEKPGRYTDTLSTQYVFRGQDAAAATNKAFTVLKHQTLGFFVSRWGKAQETAWAAGDIVDVIPVALGIQVKQPPEANSVHRIMQRAFIRDAVKRDVVVA